MLHVGGVACRTQPLVLFLPKISLRVELHQELMGSSEATPAGQLRLYLSRVVQHSPARSCKCSDCGNLPVHMTCV
jgi:hypothetical protein